MILFCLKKCYYIKLHNWRKIFIFCRHQSICVMIYNNKINKMNTNDIGIIISINERLIFYSHANLTFFSSLDCLIRSELMEQVPHIAIYCQEVPDHLGHAVPHHLLPLVVKFLVDNNHQVSQSEVLLNFLSGIYGGFPVYS